MLAAEEYFLNWADHWKPPIWLLISHKPLQIGENQYLHSILKQFSGAYNGWSAFGNPLQRILIPPSNISIPIGKHHEDLASTTAFHCQKSNIPMAVTAGFVIFALPTHCTPLSRLCNCPHRLGNSKVVLTSAFRVPSLLFTSTITTRTTHFCLVHLRIEHWLVRCSSNGFWIVICSSNRASLSAKQKSSRARQQRV